MESGTRETTTGRRGGVGAAIRAAGRHPGRSAAGAALLALAGLWAWWATQLWGLPDVGAPFDVAAFEAARVPGDRNAFFAYREAAALIRAPQRQFQASGKPEELNKYPASWAEANLPWRGFLAGSGGALAAWREGTERPDFLYEHPEGLSFRTLLPVTQEIRTLARLAILEGSRLEAEGDLAGAWGWYRATLRSSRHSGRHGFQIERLVGAAIHDEASKATTRWAADPRVDAPLLRRALAEVVALDAMTVPRSESLKGEYLLFARSMGDPHLIEDLLISRGLDGPTDDWCQDLPVSDAAKGKIHAARLIAADDRERSVRVARLLTANWLAQVDKPPSRRARLARQDPPIYEADPAAPPSSRALSPEELSGWLDSSLLASRFFRNLAKSAPAIDRERARQANLVVHLADQLHRREHGGAPPPSPRALVGPYLEALPEWLGEPAEARP